VQLPAQVRRAVDADAGALAELAEHTFRATFAAANTAENIDRFCAATYGVPLQLAEIHDAGLETWLAEVNGTLAGYAQVRSGEAPAVVGGSRPLEIQRLYVHHDWLGKGVAQSLMNHLLARARLRDADVVWLGVWERNPRAIAFYRKWGFEAVGEHVFVLGDEHQRDLLMRLVPGSMPAG
jgi:diamine N-acetyltransferase